MNDDTKAQASTLIDRLHRYSLAAGRMQAKGYTTPADVKIMEAEADELVRDIQAMARQFDAEGRPDAARWLRMAADARPRLKADVQ